MLGICIGAAGINFLTAYRIDELQMNQKKLIEKLTSSQSEIEHLQKNLADRSNRNLTAINVHVQIKQTDLTKVEAAQIEIETVKNVKKRLASLLGQDLSNLNYRQIALIIDGRETRFNDQIYRQTVDLVVVTDHIDLYLTVIPQKAIPPPYPAGPGIIAPKLTFTSPK